MDGPAEYSMHTNFFFSSKVAHNIYLIISYINANVPYTEDMANYGLTLKKVEFGLFVIYLRSFEIFKRKTKYCLSIRKENF